jgi:hypothetical protein
MELGAIAIHSGAITIIFGAYNLLSSAKIVHFGAIKSNTRNPYHLTLELSSVMVIHISI